MIERAIIKNYKGLRNAEIEFHSNLNIIVGDNETGKSTVLEALNLAMTGQLNRRPAAYELHPFLFNQATTEDYVAALRVGTVAPPKISIELFFRDDESLAVLKGSNNSRSENCPGVHLRVELDDNFSEEYMACIAQPERVRMVPVEYYHVVWESFALETLNLRTMPLKPVLIDPGAITNNYAANRYILDIARDHLTRSQQADLALSYRSMREIFQNDTKVAAINTRLAADSADITDKVLSVGLDMTSKSGWESTVLPHLDELPLNQVGKGEQNAVKIKLGLKASAERHVVLIEEPENHLSHTNLSKLIGDISSSAAGRQLIVTTHSSFVLNKLGVENTLMFNGETAVTLNDLPSATKDYFLKLPGHDTLRMVLATRTILVEGPSDELVVQRAYKQTYSQLPLEDGVEVISVNSLAFKRFLDVARLLRLHVSVVTDNDAAPEKVRAKYKDYEGEGRIQICYSTDAGLPTLEPQLLASNGFEKLSRILDQTVADEEALANYMEKHKTEVALKIFQSEEDFEVPTYIAEAIA